MKLEEIVAGDHVVLTEHELKQIKSLIRDFIEEDKENCLQLKSFLFGINVSEQDAYSESVFERILATPNAGDLIETVWREFHLFEENEMYMLVSI